MVQLPLAMVQVVGLKLPVADPVTPNVTVLPLAVPADPLSVAVTVNPEVTPYPAVTELTATVGVAAAIVSVLLPTAAA